MDNLAFVPLDIDVPEINLDEFEQWVNNYSMANIVSKLNSDNTSPSNGPFNLAVAKAKGDFTDIENIQETHYNSFANRMKLQPDAMWHNNFDTLFPELVELINSLPMIVTHFEVLTNKRDIFSHCDEWEVGDEFVDPLWGPFFTRTEDQKKMVLDYDIPVSMIKVFIYENPQSKKKSFYMAKDLLGDHIYCWGPNNSFVAAMSKVQYPHGADMVTDGSRKFVFNIHGIIKKEEHLKLVERSLYKYKEYACWF